MKCPGSSRAFGEVMAQLRIEILAKDFREPGSGTLKHVLGQLAFGLGPGERVALVGPSGCGKTTLLNIVAGLDDGFSGRIERPADARIGYVFQEPRLLPWRTVAANLRLVLEGPRAEVEARIREVLAEVGLAGEEATYAANLSLGMARRVAIARALVIDPDILLLDEPFVSLDEPTARRLRLLLLDLLERHHPTTLFVTHDLREAVMIAERMVVLSAPPARLVADVPISLTAAERRVEERIEDLRRALRRMLPEVPAEEGAA